MPANLLNLPLLSITSIVEDSHNYHIYAHALNSPSSCPACMSSEVVGFGRNEQLVKDLPMYGKRVGLYIDTRDFNALLVLKHSTKGADRLMKNGQCIKRTLRALPRKQGL